MKFLKNFKKNEIVIYAIALMLVTAGYFNYTTNIDNASIETYSENINEISDEYANIGDARLVASNDIIENNTTENTNTTTQNQETTDNTNNTEETTKETASETTDSSTNETTNENSTEVATNNETTDTSSETTTENAETNNDYFVSSKLERDTNYASMISTYTKILEDSSVSETEKAIAMKEITEINDNKNAISICENLISTKGFTNCIILVNQDSINVVVSLDGELTTDKVAKIQNIVSREFNCEIENIHITQNQ